MTTISVVNQKTLFVACRKEHKSCEFELHEAYAIDIIISTGEGKVS